MSFLRGQSSKGRVVLFYPTIEGLWKYVWFPFPYLYLGPFLEGAGFEVQVIDARVEDGWRESLMRGVGEACCFGVTGMTGPDLTNAMEACRLVRGIRPDLPIVWGGHHARQLPDQIIHEGMGDYVFIGPAEYGLVEMLMAMRESREPENICGLVYAKDGHLAGNRSFPRIDFDYDIFPGFHLVNVERYRSPNNIVSYFSSRGCPFRCSFCTTGDFNHSYRTMMQFEREVEHIVGELGFRNVFFQDGTFFISSKRVLAVARKMLELGPDIKWKAKARANSILDYPDADLRLLYESGLRSIFFGIESGSQKVLDTMEKRIRPEHAVESAALCATHGFEFYASFMFATPGETVDDLKKTIALIREIKRINPEATIQNSVYIPLPGTPMYDMCIERGYRPPETMEGWAARDITSNFENRDDITWMEPSSLREYVRIYNDEFPDYKHVYEREKEGKYRSPLH